MNFKATRLHEKLGFPGVVGAVDFTHTKMQSPGGDDAELYRNRKQSFSYALFTQAFTGGKTGEAPFQLQVTRMHFLPAISVDRPTLNENER